MRDLFLYVHVQIFSLQKHCYFKINRICPCCAKSCDIHVCVCVCVCSREREMQLYNFIPIHTIGYCCVCVYDQPAFPVCVQFEQENRALYEEMNSMTEDVRSVLPLCLNQEVSVFLEQVSGVGASVIVQSFLLLLGVRRFAVI